MAAALARVVGGGAETSSLSLAVQDGRHGDTNLSERLGGRVRGLHARPCARRSDEKPDAFSLVLHRGQLRRGRLPHLARDRHRLAESHQARVCRQNGPRTKLAALEDAEADATRGRQRRPGPATARPAPRAPPSTVVMSATASRPGLENTFKATPTRREHDSDAGGFSTASYTRFARGDPRASPVAFRRRRRPSRRPSPRPPEEAAEAAAVARRRRVRTDVFLPSRAGLEPPTPCRRRRSVDPRRREPTSVPTTGTRRERRAGGLRPRPARPATTSASSPNGRSDVIPPRRPARRPPSIADEPRSSSGHDAAAEALATRRRDDVVGSTSSARLVGRGRAASRAGLRAARPLSAFFFFRTSGGHSCDFSTAALLGSGSTARQEPTRCAPRPRCHNHGGEKAQSEREQRGAKVASRAAEGDKVRGERLRARRCPGNGGASACCR